MIFPRSIAAKLHSKHPIERLGSEIKRRTEVVGIFLREAAIIRLVDAILMEQSAEWAAQRVRYMTLETMASLSDDPSSCSWPYRCMTGSAWPEKLGPFRSYATP